MQGGARASNNYHLSKTLAWLAKSSESTLDQALCSAIENLFEEIWGFPKEHCHQWPGTRLHLRLVKTTLDSLHLSGVLYKLIGQPPTDQHLNFSSWVSIILRAFREVDTADASILDAYTHMLQIKSLPHTFFVRVLS